MKKVQLINYIIMMIALIILGINVFFISLSDWVVRVAGTAAILDVVLVVYSTVKIGNGKG